MCSKQQIHVDANTIHFPFLGRNWQILRGDMEALWEEMVDVAEEIGNPSFKKDERLPYWAELWPSSLALASWLYENKEQIAHKTCMDLGCGLGFTALCAQYAGAQVLGVDYEEKAIMLAKENSLANHILDINFEVMDWRKPCVAPRSFDYIWAADIVYERSFAKPVMDFLDYALTDNGKAFIAEPSRTIFDAFIELIKNTPNFKMEKIFYQETKALSENIPSARVNIWQIERV